MTLNLTGAAGHVAVVGGPRSGKSTLLRSIVTSMALVTTPMESQFFVLDFGGGTFAPLTRLPHVSGVATRSEPDVVRRVMAEVEGIVDRREAYFREQRHRLHRDLPLASRPGSRRRRLGRRLPRHRRLEHAARGVRRPRDGDPAARRARPDLRPPHRHRVHPLGRLPRRDARRLRLQARAAPRRPARLRDRPQGRRPRAGRSSRSRSRAVQAALPRRAAAHRRRRQRRHPRRRRRRPHRQMAAAWKGPQGPKLRLLPEMVTLDAIREDAVRRQAAGAPDPARHQREGARPGRPRRRRRAAHADLRRRPVGQERAAADLRPRDHAHPHAQGGADRPRRLPALAARRGPRRVPPQLPDLRHPGDADAEGHREPTSRAASPVPT